MSKSKDEVISDLSSLITRARQSVYASGTIAELRDLVIEQNRTIEYLKEKVIRLQDELDNINDY